MEIRIDNKPFTQILHYYGVLVINEIEYPFILIDNKVNGDKRVEWTKMFPSGTLQEMLIEEKNIIQQFIREQE